MSDSPALVPSIPSDSVIEQGGFKLVSIKNLDPELKQALKDTVANGTTDTQLAYFLTVAEAQQLNPFLKEVWCILYGGKLTIQTGRDGFLKIAKRDPLFDSIQSAEVREGDVFTMDTASGSVEHRVSLKRGAILGAYAIITRKDGRKLVKYVTLSEYRGQSPIWDKYTSSMICKAAESAICKQFANISGVMAEELMPTEGRTVDASPAAQEFSTVTKDELLAKIAACQTNAELDELKQAMPPLIGKLFESEKTEVLAAATKRRRDLSVLDVTPADVPAKADDEAVEEEQPEEAATAEVPEEASQVTKATAEQAQELLRACKTLDELENCWTVAIPTMNLDELAMQKVKKTYEMRIPLLTGTAPKKTKKAA